MSAVRTGLIAFALVHFTLAALMAFAPQVFFADIGPYGVRNDHYLRDLASFEFAFAVVLLVSVWHASWRVPVLCCVALQFALHAVNHLADIAGAHPQWLGPANFISLALATALLAWLARESMRPQEVQR